MPYIVSRAGLTAQVAILVNDQGEEMVLSEESLEVVRKTLPYEDDSKPDKMMPLYVETFKDFYGRPTTRPHPRRRVWELRETDPDKW